MTSEHLVGRHTRATPTVHLKRPLALGWLVGFWVIFLVLSSFGMAAGHLAEPTDVQWSGSVFGLSFVIGGPFFLITWNWLLVTPAFRHRPFVLLPLTWIATLVSLAVVASLIELPLGVLVLVLDLLPVVSSGFLVHWTLEARRRERAYFESSSRAT